MSWKGFQKMASRNVPNNFTVFGRSVYLHKVDYFEGNVGNDCIVLYFSEIK